MSLKTFFASLRRLFRRRSRRGDVDPWILEQTEVFKRDRDRRDLKMIKKYSLRPYRSIFSERGDL